MPTDDERTDPITELPLPPPYEPANLPPGIPDLPYYRQMFARAEATLQAHKVDQLGLDVPGHAGDFVVLRESQGREPRQGETPLPAMTPGTTRYVVIPVPHGKSVMGDSFLPVGGPAAETPASTGVPIDVLIAICLDKLDLVSVGSHNVEYLENAAGHLKNALAALHALAHARAYADRLAASNVEAADKPAD